MNLLCKRGNSAFFVASTTEARRDYTRTQHKIISRQEIEWNTDRKKYFSVIYIKFYWHDSTI